MNNKIKSYTSIWNVEKVIYAINDFQLPFPVTFAQIAWFTLTLLVVIVFGDIPPLSLIQGALLKYLGIPVGVSWVLSQKSFDSKKPYRFLKSVLGYQLRDKSTYLGKPVKLKTQPYNESYTYAEGGQDT